MAPARHITKRYRTWYAVLDIPAAVRDHFGGLRKFSKTLETHSETQALVRAPFLIAKWQAEIARARGTTMDPLEADVQWVKKLQSEESVARASGDGWVYDKDDDVHGENPGADAIKDMWRDFLVDMDRKDPGRAKEVFERATGKTVPTLEHLEAHLADVDCTDRSRDLKRADVTRLARQFPTTADVTRKAVRLWSTKLVTGGTLKRASVVRLLSSCRMYWRYLRDIEGVVAEGVDPFDNLGLPRTKSGSAKATEKAAYDPKDVVALLHAAEDKGDQQLVDLITLAMYSGARLGELCALKVEAVDLDEWLFTIVDAKSDAGWRQVPVHANLQGTMERLVRDSADGYVLSGLTANQYGERKGAIGQRFGKMKTAMGFDKTRDFHSVRRTVATILENAGVLEGVTADIVGHAKKTLTYGLYSGGATLETKRAALEKLVYPL